MEDEVIKLQDTYYILATSSRTDDWTRVLKHGETFAVFDRFGDVQPVGLGEQGIYHQGTRFLSRLEVRIGGRRPLLLSSTVKEENDLLTVDLTTPDITGRDGALLLPRGQVHLHRAKFLWQGACYERVRISNFGLTPVDADATVHFDSDFADIFEVRGTKRARRGRRLDDRVEAREGIVTLGYRGLDDQPRFTRLTFDPPPAELSGINARFDLHLAPRAATTIYLSIECGVREHATRGAGFASASSAASSGASASVEDGVFGVATSGAGALPPRSAQHDEALVALEADLQRAQSRRCEIRSSNTQLSEWVGRSMADLTMMTTETETGPYPFAGVPWFSAPFGRDGIITALELLWLDPELARGVLRYLAATQATETVPEQDAQPGKILHETRRGEMAGLGEVPFGRYYGSVDATPLFVVLAGAYYRRTGDMATAAALWPNVQRALRWIETEGDHDGDGFVEYMRQSPHGLVQQGWKDSSDSVFHQDGALAEGPVALCEVQGYVYAAHLAAAELAEALGHGALAVEQRGRARDLQQRFEERFWSESLGTYVLALDGAKRRCEVRASNAGHALFAGIASPERARRVAQLLFDDTHFSGWGVRTLASSEVRYNPMSYHNGSVWPHDNALIAEGLGRYHLHERALRPLAGLFAASTFVDLHRLPELFCGFPRRPGEGPTLYPVACAPQAWAAGAVFMLLAACLGIQIDGRRKEVSFCHPKLPDSLPDLRINNLRVDGGSVDLMLENQPHDVGITVLRRTGDISVVVMK